MTNKQMRKLAKQIYECELIHGDLNATKEEKSRADNRIMQITNQVMALPDGISIMLNIDTLVQSLAETSEGEK